MVQKVMIALALACLLTAHAGCKPDPNTDGDGDGDSDTDADGDSDGDTDGDSDSDSDYDWDDTCDSQEFHIHMEPVRVMLLLDQSSSMVESAWGGHSHWEEVTNGLTGLLDDPANEDLYFGLDPFPDGDLAYMERCYDECCRDPACLLTQVVRCVNMSLGCGRSCAVDLPPWVPLTRAPDARDPILEFVNMEWTPSTFGNTPIVDQLRYYLEDHSAEMPDFYRDDGSAYLVVISDGDDTCEDGADDPDVAAIVAALSDVTGRLVTERGIRSFAIGFGDTSGDMARELNAIAANGGTDFTSFFPVSEEGALQAAFSEISSSIISCIYDIEEVSATADPLAVNFYFDGEVVGYDPTCANGWRWVDIATHDQVEFCGATCEHLKSGAVESIEARFGCATILW